METPSEKMFTLKEVLAIIESEEELEGPPPDDVRKDLITIMESKNPDYMADVMRISIIFTKNNLVKRFLQAAKN